MPFDSPGFLTAGVYSATAILILLVSLAVSVWIARKIGRLIARGMESFAPDAGVRWVSLILACLLVPSAPARVVGALLYIANAAIRGYPNAVRENWTTKSPCLFRETLAGDCFMDLGFGLADAATLTAEKVLASVPIPDWWFMLWLAIWVLGAQALRDAPGQADASGLSSIGRWYGSLRHATRQNLLLFAILAVAVYLSVAAIAAIPGLIEESAGDRTSIGNLEDALKQLPQRRDLKELLGQDPFRAVEPRLAALETGLRAAAAPARDPAQAAAPVQTASIAEPVPAEQASSSPDPAAAANRVGMIAYLRGEVALQRRLRQMLFDAYERLAASRIGQAQDARPTAIKSYELSNRDRPASREAAEHFVSIQAWHTAFVSQSQREMEECIGGLERVDKAFEDWSANVVMQLPRDNGPINASYDLDVRDVYNSPLYDNARSTCSAFAFIGPFPQRPELGARLGPFRFVASWLLRTESISIVLIVGLLGFGLLGAACSTIVRERGVRQVEAPLVTDLPPVIIRGLSAAIVVFLAVKGGLAVFATGTAEPNPYVLLLTCFIAAVYSEPIWEWAKRYLDDLVSRRQRGPHDPSAGSAAGSPHAKPPAAAPGP